MKIAIMTQPLGKNYGGIMQAWALQQVLKSMGHDPVTIDRQFKNPGLGYKTARFAYRALMKTLGRRKAPINFENNYPSIFKNTNTFIDENIRISEPLHSTEHLRAHFYRKKYDAVIVGSDQTWRPNYSPNILNFYLDFIVDKEIIRIAYASSFGVDDWQYNSRQTKECSFLLNKFSAVGVREKSAINLCKKYLNTEAELVIDPTLLLGKSDYEKLLKPSKPPEKEDRYVFSYILDSNSQKDDIKRRVSENLKINIKTINPNKFIEDTNGVLPPISEWISAFKNSEFIVTDSFHGMVFSIIFEKPFLVITNSSRGNARFNSLLDQLDLKCRIFENHETLDDKIQFKFPPETNKKLEILKKNSLIFLEKKLVHA